MKLLILATGRLKDQRIASLMEDYVVRVRRHLPLDVKEARKTSQILDLLPRGYESVALDSSGVELSSSGLASALQDRMNRSVAGMAFCIGDADGFDDETKKKVDWSLSLSRMTFPHRLARLLLAEQLYRALSIIHSEPYNH